MDYIVRRPSSIVSPTFWAEDGTIFFKGAIQPGGARSSSRMPATVALPAWDRIPGRAVARPDPTSDLLRVSDRGGGRFDRHPPLAPAGDCLSLITGSSASSRCWSFPAGRRPLRHAQQCPLVARHRLDIARNAQRSATTCGASRGVGVHSHRELVRDSLPFTVFRCWASAPSEIAQGIRWAIVGIATVGVLVQVTFLVGSSRRGGVGPIVGDAGRAVLVLIKRVFATDVLGAANLEALAPLKTMDPPPGRSRSIHGSDDRIPLDPRCQRSSHST